MHIWRTFANVAMNLIELFVKILLTSFSIVIFSKFKEIGLRITGHYTQNWAGPSGHAV